MEHCKCDIMRNGKANAINHFCKDKSEMGLLLSDVSKNIVPLKMDLAEIFRDLNKIGYLKCSVKNDYAISEIKTNFPTLNWIHDNVAVSDGEVELKFLSETWKYAFVYDKDFRQNLSFFDDYGRSLITICLTEKSNVNDLKILIGGFRLNSSVNESFDYKKNLNIKNTLLLDKPDVKDFKYRWDSLENNFDLREDANEEKVQSLNKNGLLTFLKNISNDNIPIKVSISNIGVSQTYEGLIKNIQFSSEEITILDPDFYCRISAKDIRDIWWVKCPNQKNRDYLKIYDNTGGVIVQLFHSPEGADRIKQKNSYEKWLNLTIRCSS